MAAARHAGGGPGGVLARVPPAHGGEPALLGRACRRSRACPTPGDLAMLERAATATTRRTATSQYLLGAARKRAGRYEEAAELYRRMLAAAPDDAYARNNLANIEFVARRLRHARSPATRRAPNPARARSSRRPPTTTSRSRTCRSSTTRPTTRRVRTPTGWRGRSSPQYDRWKYDSGDYAVVDLGLHAAAALGEARRAQRRASRERNVVAGGGPARVAGARRCAAFANRFPRALGVFALIGAGRRGAGAGRRPSPCTARSAAPRSAATASSATPSGGLCSQCYHLFVVRDGVSGPARNRKMAEVQRAETRTRPRLPRALGRSLREPGHLYAGRTLVGARCSRPGTRSSRCFVASRLVPLTDVASRLVPPWPLVVGRPAARRRSGCSRTGSSRSSTSRCRRAGRGRAARRAAQGA